MRGKGREEMNATERLDGLAGLSKEPARISEGTPFVAEPFVPRRFLRNGHLQTIVGNFLPREDRLPIASSELVEVSSATEMQIATQVLCK